MAIWRYDMRIPDDTPDDELEPLRVMAEALWETSTEAAGAHGPNNAPPAALLLELDNPGTELNEKTGRVEELPKRIWRIEGEAL